MAPGDVEELRERIASLEASSDNLKDIIERRIEQEDRVQHSRFEALHAKLAGEIAKLDAKLKILCEGRGKFEDEIKGKISRDITRIHERIDELLLAISEKTSDAAIAVGTAGRSGGMNVNVRWLVGGGVGGAVAFKLLELAANHFGGIL